MNINKYSRKFARRLWRQTFIDSAAFARRQRNPGKPGCFGPNGSSWRKFIS